MEPVHSGQKSSPTSTRVEQPVQWDGKKRETKDLKTTSDTAEVDPNKETRREENKSRNQTRRHRSAYHIWTNPWQKRIRRLRAELGDELKRLLAKNPAGMETNRDEERTRAKCGICEQEPRDKKGKEAPAKKRPRRSTGKCQRNLLEPARPAHGLLQRLTRCPHEMNHREGSSGEEGGGMARHHGNSNAKQDTTKKKFLDDGNSTRRAADAKDSGYLKAVLERKNTGKDVAGSQKRDRQEGQQKSKGEIRFPTPVRMETEIREAADSNASKRRPEKEDG